MAILKIYNGSSWDDVVAKVWNGTSWEESMAYYDGTAWVDLFTSGPLSPVLAGDSQSRAVTAWCGPYLKSDGQEYLHANDGTQEGSSLGAWLDSGSAGDYWIEAKVTVGSWSSGITNLRQVLSTSRPWYVQASFTTKAVTGYFIFWDAASGGNIVHQSDSHTWTATGT